MLAVVAAAMTVVMAAGDFDLSVGSMASLAGVTAAVLFTLGWPVAAGVAAALGVGLAGGLLNGALVAYGRHAALRGNARNAHVFFRRGLPRLRRAHDLRPRHPRRLRRLRPQRPAARQPGGRPLVLPNLTLVALAVLAGVWVALERRRFGRWLYAIGDNPEAARLAGVPVRRMRLAAFACTGLGAAVAGLMYAARVASANPTQGAGLMLSAIAAVFLGQTMTSDGSPRVLATARRGAGARDPRQRADPAQRRFLCPGGAGRGDHHRGGMGERAGAAVRGR